MSFAISNIVYSCRGNLESSLSKVDIIAAIVIKCSDSSTSEVKAWIDEDANLMMEIPTEGSKSRVEISMAETQEWIKNWKLQNRAKKPPKQLLSPV